MTHALPCQVEIAAGRATFATGLALLLVDALRRTVAGEVFAVTSDPNSPLDADLDAWSRLTGNAIVNRTMQGDVTRWVIRHGPAPLLSDDDRPLGTRLWLYTNFDCNLACDYCCVRSSPTAERRELGLERVLRITEEAPALGTRAFFLTGGEPFLLSNIAEIIRACAAAAPTTVLTNGMLFQGPRLEALRTLPRDLVTLQISIDSGSPALHDLRRGRGSWHKAWAGVEVARQEGFRVRLAATVSSDSEEEAFREFLDGRQIVAEDRVIRRVALRGAAQTGIPLARADIVPELTITADGAYWHPVGAEDDDLLLTRDVFPLARAFEAARRAAAEQRVYTERLATVFHCA